MSFSLDTYNQNDMGVSVCGNICLAKDEVFEYLQITNSARRWKVDYVGVISFQNKKKRFFTTFEKVYKLVCFSGGDFNVNKTIFATF